MAIELPVELEQRLERGARVRGISKNEFATRLVADNLPEDERLPSPTGDEAASRARFARIAAQVRARAGAAAPFIPAPQSPEQREQAVAALEAEWEQMRRDWGAMTPAERAEAEAEQAEFLRQMDADRRSGE